MGLLRVIRNEITFWQESRAMRKAFETADRELRLRLEAEASSSGASPRRVTIRLVEPKQSTYASSRDDDADRGANETRASIERSSNEQLHTATISAAISTLTCGS